MNYLFEKVRRSLGGPFFLRPISVLQLPFFVLRTPCFVALLRETCPATDARGRVVFAGPSCPRWDSCEFLGFCPAAVARTLRFRRVCPVNLAGSCGFAFLLFFGGGMPFALAGGFPAFFVWSRSCRGDLSVAKTKISLFCNFFAIRGSFFQSRKVKTAAKRRITCGFVSRSAIGRLATIANRKKVAV